MVRGLFFVALFAGPVAALAADCESIPKTDTRNLCLAQVEKSPAHCRHIRNEGRREQCLTLAR